MFKKISLLLFLVGVSISYQNCAPGMQLDQASSDINYMQQVHSQNHDIEPPRVKPAPVKEHKFLMDRKMIYSLFVDIFGPSAANLSALNSIRADRAVFGGSCSQYERFFSARNQFKLDPSAENCQNNATASHLGAPVEPVANVLQQARINDVCHQVVNTTVTLNHALARIQTGASSTRLPSGSLENIQKLFRLFYRAKPAPDQDLFESLQILIGEPVSLNGWKEAIQTVCLSSHWQAL